MKVAIVVPVFCTGGAENMAAQLAVNLDRSQVDVEVISMYSRQGHVFEKKIEDAGIPIHYLDKQGHASLGAMLRLWKCLSKMKPDVVHVHMYSVFYALPWIYTHRAHMVRTIHIQPDDEFNPFLRWLLHCAARTGKIVPVTISKLNREVALKLYRCGPELYPCVNNPVELDRFYHLPRKDSDPVSFISVGRLEERKNQILAIRALPEVIRGAGRVKLVLLGEGETREDLCHEAERLGVRDAVELMGNQSNPEDFLAKADVFLMTSHMEGLPLSALEAMASGLPVIATDVGGLADLVKDNGMLIADDDLQALTREMIRFARDPELRQRCGEISREMVKAYDAGSCARAYTEIYKKLCGSLAADRIDRMPVDFGCLPEEGAFMEYKRWVKRALRILPDPLYLRLRYLIAFRKPLHLKNPQTFNEKLQWLKLYDRNPEYTRMVDKFEAKKYVAERIGEEYIIPTLGVWDRFADIDFDALPDQFVLKCTHDSGGLVICKDKKSLDMDAARKKITARLKENYYWNYREWPYKNVRRRILAEKYMVDDLSTSGELSDYKVLCFGGEPRLVEIHRGRFSGHHTQDFYDTDWNKTDFQQPDDPLSDEIMEKPVFAEEMFRLSRILAAGIPHVRVDWYYTGGKLYFGELTFFDGSGLSPFIDNQDEILGAWLTLPDGE